MPVVSAAGAADTGFLTGIAQRAGIIIPAHTAGAFLDGPGAYLPRNGRRGFTQALGNLSEGSPLPEHVLDKNALFKSKMSAFSHRMPSIPAIQKTCNTVSWCTSSSFS